VDSLRSLVDSVRFLVNHPETLAGVKLVAPVRCPRIRHSFCLTCHIFLLRGFQDSGMTSEHRLALSYFKDSHLKVDDASADKLATLYAQVEKFIVDDLADGFQLRDIYSLIVAVMNGLELAFTDEEGPKLKTYAMFFVEKIITVLVGRGVLPSEVTMLLHLVPVGTVIDLISHITKNVPFVNRFGASASEVRGDEWVRRNWVPHGRANA
jgi:hypothetical protein